MKKNFAYLAGLLIVATIIITSVFFIYRKPQLSSTSQPENKQLRELSSSVNIKNWNLYRSPLVVMGHYGEINLEKFAFSIKYPKTWFKNEKNEVDSGQAVIFSESPVPDVWATSSPCITASVGIGPYIPLDTAPESVEKLNANYASSGYGVFDSEGKQVDGYPRIVSSNKFLLNGRMAIEREIIKFGSTKPILQTTIIGDETYLDYRASYSALIESCPNTDKEIYRANLLTFKFGSR